MKKNHALIFIDTTFKGLRAKCWCGWNIETSNIPVVYRMGFKHIDETNY